MKAKVFDIVQLSPAQTAHCGFKFGQVVQINGDGSLYVTGKPGDGGEWFISDGEYQTPAKTA